MTELRKGFEAIGALERNRKSGFPGWVWFAPGDNTRYRVHLIHMVPVHAAGPMESAPVTRALLVQVEVDPRNPRSIVVAEPGEHTRFTPETWVQYGFPPGWWAGVRPLLAALDWTDQDYSSYEFQAGDAADITYVYNQQQRLRPVGRTRR